MDDELTISDELRKLAERVGDEATQDMDVTDFYFRLCFELTRAGHMFIPQDDLAQVTLVAFQRRQDRFPDVPILNRAGVYARG